MFAYHDEEIDNFCGGLLITRQQVLAMVRCFRNIQEWEWRWEEVDMRIGMVRMDEVEREEGNPSPVHDISIVTLQAVE